IPFLLLELKSLEMIFKSKEKNSSGQVITKVSTPQMIKKNEPIEPLRAAEEFVSSLPLTVELPNFDQVMKKQEEVPLTINTQQIIEKWDELLAVVRQRNCSI